MFKIKECKIENNIIIITDKYDKQYRISANDSKITGLLSQASTRSKSICKNINYMNKYHKIAIILALICIFGASLPVLFGKSYAPVFVLMFGGFGAANISLAVASKIFKNWLKKYSMSNEFWEKIYELAVNKNVVNQNNYLDVKTYAKQNNSSNYIPYDISKEFEKPNDYSYSEAYYNPKKVGNLNTNNLYARTTSMNHYNNGNSNNSVEYYVYGKNNIIQDYSIDENNKTKVYKRF